MTILQISQQPSITDWIQAVAAAIGALATVAIPIIIYRAQRKKDRSSQHEQRLNDIKPFFVMSISSNSGAEFRLLLTNKGEMAFKVKCLDPKVDHWDINLAASSTTKTDGTVTINGKSTISLTKVPSPEIAVEILIGFEDKGGNKYSQKISRSENKSFELKDPFLT